jgi:hypothetical protein
MDKYTKSMVYLSDSAGRDPKKDISDYLKIKCQKNLQLLIHTIWWMKKSTIAFSVGWQRLIPEEILDKFNKGSLVCMGGQEIFLLVKEDRQ